MPEQGEHVCLASGQAPVGAYRGVWSDAERAEQCRGRIDMPSGPQPLEAGQRGTRLGQRDFRPLCRKRGRECELQERVEEIRKSAQEAVDKAAAALGDQPKSVSVVALSGFPAKTLIDASENSDLVVVGSRGGGGFGALFVGSVSSQVVHHAKCPVVVVPTGR